MNKLVCFAYKWLKIKDLKKGLLRLSLLFLLFCLNEYSVFGQEYYDAVNTPRQYYYNNLESATAGTPSTFFPSCASSIPGGTAIKIATSSIVNGGTKSFSTVGASTIRHGNGNLIIKTLQGELHLIPITAEQW
jgi:hypothetical protein